MTPVTDLLAQRPTWQHVLRTVETLECANSESIAQQSGLEFAICKRILSILSYHGHISLVGGPGRSARWMSKAAAQAHANRGCVPLSPPVSEWWNRGTRVMRKPTPAELEQLAEQGL